MSLTSTKFDWSTNDSAQLTVTFDAKPSAEFVAVEVKLYEGPGSGNLLASDEYALTPGRPAYVKLTAGNRELEGSLQQDDNCISFEGRLVEPEVVNIGLQPMIVAVVSGS